jgi:hypothetical protein
VAKEAFNLTDVNARTSSTFLQTLAVPKKSTTHRNLIVKSILLGTRYVIELESGNIPTPHDMR